MITKEAVTNELQARIQASVKLKKDIQSAQTSTKRTYLQKKLVKNNLVASKLLVALEKITKIQGKENATQTNDADGSSQEES